MFMHSLLSFIIYVVCECMRVVVFLHHCPHALFNSVLFQEIIDNCIFVMVCLTVLFIFCIYIITHVEWNQIKIVKEKNPIQNQNCSNISYLSSINSGPQNATYLRDGETVSITSPNYPLNYPNYANQWWLLGTQHDLATVLHFIDFQLESSYDFLYVYVGNTSYSQFATLKTTLSGYTLPNDIVSTETYTWLHFSSDYSVTYRGFHLAATAKNISGLY